MGNSICTGLLIYFWVPSSCFCHDQPLFRWNNPVQRCLPVGEAALSTPEAVVCFMHWLTDCFDVTDDDQRNIITQSIIFSFSIRPTPSCILHRAQQSSRSSAPVSRFASFGPSAFVALLGFVGNGVITVMINSPWQADRWWRLTRAEIIAVTLLSINLSDRSARFEFLQSASALCSNWP